MRFCLVLSHGAWHFWEHADEFRKPIKKNSLVIGPAFKLFVVLQSSINEHESSIIEYESYLMQLESSVIQLDRSLIIHI